MPSKSRATKSQIAQPDSIENEAKAAAHALARARFLNSLRSPSRRAGRTICQRLLLKPILRAAVRVRVDGRENLRELDPNKSFIVIANHSSHFDAPLMLTSLPHGLAARVATAAAADYFFDRPWKAPLMHAFFNAFPVERGHATTKTSADQPNYHGLTHDLLQAGVPILLFPEGTRSRDGNLGEFQPGAAKLAVEFQTPVIPLTLIGAHAAWPKGAKRPQFRASITVKIAPPMLPKRGETAEKFNARLHAVIAKNLNQS
jgi:1-acyl-sn-glycerol-3-phosphate acyltransferase